uniref:Putative secreted protein n=1 Tax=Ixodes ricinus TaxID=34613 RepID=A0A6B0TUW2_IXORI
MFSLLCGLSGAGAVGCAAPTLIFHLFALSTTCFNEIPTNQNKQISCAIAVAQGSQVWRECFRDYRGLSAVGFDVRLT